MQRPRFRQRFVAAGRGWRRSRSSPLCVPPRDCRSFTAAVAAAERRTGKGQRSPRSSGLAPGARRVGRRRR
eukprot:948540-Prymnesium_polylepis.1